MLEKAMSASTKHMPHLLKLDRLNDVKDLLELVEEHDLLGAVRLRPELQQPHDHLLRQARVLLQELHHTVG